MTAAIARKTTFEVQVPNNSLNLSKNPDDSFKK